MELTLAPIRWPFADYLLIWESEDECVEVPEPIEATVHDAPWDVRFVVRIDPEASVPVVTEVLIAQRDGGPAISADTIRGLQLGEATKEAVRRASVRFVREGDVMRSKVGRDQVGRRQLSLAFRRPTRRAVTDEQIESAAAAYREAVDAGRRDVLIAVAKSENVSRATAGRRVKRARELGLIGEEV